MKDKPQQQVKNVKKTHSTGSECNDIVMPLHPALLKHNPMNASIAAQESVDQVGDVLDAHIAVAVRIHPCGQITTAQ